MRNVILLIIPLFIIILAACSQSQTERAPITSTIPTRTSTPHVISTSKPDTNNQISNTPIPYPVPVQLDESPATTISPYPAPGQGMMTPPPPTVTLSQSPIIVKPTSTFPPSLITLRIAYIAKGKLWLRNTETATQLTDVDDTTYRVNISDDGKVIAFTRESGLWAINSDGTGERLLISKDDFQKIEPTDPGVGLSQLDWIPNTHTLLFNTRLNTGYGISMTDDLHMVNADTQHYTVLLPPNKGGRFIPSPDGKLLAIITPTEINLMSVDGGNYHTVFKYPSVAIPSEFAFYASPVWASDSKSLMVAIPSSEVYYNTTSPTMIWQIPTDGKQAVVISEIEAERGQYVNISPDFLKIAVLKVINWGSPSEYTELHIGEIDGSNGELYPGCNSWFIEWADDSKHFVCQFDRSYQLGQLGSDAILLTDKGDGFAWVGSSNFIYTYGYSGLEEIRLGFIGEPSIILVGPENGPIYYDFSK